MNRSKAAVLTTKPAGTAIPARLSSPRLPPLPPTCCLSSSPISANQPMTAVEDMAHLLQNCHDAAPAIDAYPLTVLDARCTVAGSNDSRQSILARHDRRMAHGAANIRHGRDDRLKDGRPRRIGDLADEDVALLEARDLLDRFYDPRRPFGHTTRCGKSPYLVAVRTALSGKPRVQVLAGDTPEHDNGRIIDDIGYRSERRRRSVLGPLHDGGPPLGNDLWPVPRPARGGAIGPGRHQINDRQLQLIMRKLKYILGGREKTLGREQRAELADLVEEEIRIPVFAIEFVPFNVWEYPMRQRNHLVVRGPILVRVQ